MTIHGSRKSVSTARETRIRDRDRPVTKADLKELEVYLREKRKASRGRRPSGKRPGSDKERAARALAARPSLPLNERQATLYGLLDGTPRRPKDLAEDSGLTASQLGSAMSSLCARGLARKTATGWVREG